MLSKRYESTEPELENEWLSKVMNRWVSFHLKGEWVFASR